MNRIKMDLIGVRFCIGFHGLNFFFGGGKKMKKAAVVGSLWWRSEGDSNSRIAFDDYTLSRRASSATRASLHLRVRSWQCEIAVALQMRVQR